MSFCLPVKKGWQTEQMSSRIASLVERVWYASPQAQWTSDSFVVRVNILFHVSTPPDYCSSCW